MSKTKYQIPHLLRPPRHSCAGAAPNHATPNPCTVCASTWNSTAPGAPPMRPVWALFWVAFMFLLVGSAEARKGSHKNKWDRAIRDKTRECQESAKCTANDEYFRELCTLRCLSGGCYDEVYGCEGCEEVRDFCPFCPPPRGGGSLSPHPPACPPARLPARPPSRPPARC
jgi:hypothetical protein